MSSMHISLCPCTCLNFIKLGTIHYAVRAPAHTALIEICKKIPPEVNQEVVANFFAGWSKIRDYSSCFIIWLNVGAESGTSLGLIHFASKAFFSFASYSALTLE